MVTSSRLLWIMQQLQDGRKARIKLSTHPDRFVLNVCLLPSFSADMKNFIAISWLQVAYSGLHQNVTVDHGHANSKGESHISIIMRPVPGIAYQADSRGSVDIDRIESAEPPFSHINSAPVADDGDVVVVDETDCDVHTDRGSDEHVALDFLDGEEVSAVSTLHPGLLAPVVDVSDCAASQALASSSSHALADDLDDSTSHDLAVGHMVVSGIECGSCGEGGKLHAADLLCPKSRAYREAIVALGMLHTPSLDLSIHSPGFDKLERGGLTAGNMYIGLCVQVGIAPKDGVIIAASDSWCDRCTTALGGLCPAHRLCVQVGIAPKDGVIIAAGDTWCDRCTTALGGLCPAHKREFAHVDVLSADQQETLHKLLSELVST